MPILKTLATRANLALAALLLAGPASAQQAVAPPDPAYAVVPITARLNLASIFGDAKVGVKLVLWGLLVASVAAVIVWLFQAVRIGQRHSDGIAGSVTYLSTLAAAAPLIGLFGAAYSLLDLCIGIANIRPAPSISILAPGFAEAMLSVCLGLLAAAIAAIAHRHLKAKLFSLDLAKTAA